MKICFIFDGIPHYHVHLLDEINKVHPVTVLLPRNDDFFKNEHVHESKDGQFARHYVEKKKAFYGKNVLVGFKEALRQIKPDLVIFIWPYFLELVVSPSLRRFFKSNNILIGIKEIPFFTPRYDETQEEFRRKAVKSMLHEKILNSPFNFYLQKKARKQLYSFVADYAFNYIESGKEIIGSYGMPANRIFTTYNSDNTDALFQAVQELRSKQAISQHPTKLIHIGRLVPWKRVDLLIKACAKLKSSFPNITLDVIGSGPELEHLKLLAQAEGVENQVVFRGAIYDNIQKTKFFLESTIYVLAGMGGLSINEAMAYGLPVVCSVCDGTEEHLVYEGKNGRYFEKDQLDSLVSVLTEMLHQPKRLQEMGQESIRIIQDQINEHVVVDAYLSAFKHIEQEKGLKN